MSWYKESKIVISQNIELIDEEDVVNIINSFGTRRFVIGFVKKDGSFKMMNVQKSVQRPYEDRVNYPKGAEFPIDTREYITLYDLQKASEIARKSISDVDVEKLDPALLRQAYRRVHPESIEFIKGDGKTYVVRFSSYAYDHNLNEEM